MYQWFRNGVELSGSSNLIIESGLGLRVLNAQKNHSGVYQCVATNDAGSVSVTTLVNVTNSVLTCDG